MINPNKITELDVVLKGINLALCVGGGCDMPKCRLLEWVKSIATGEDEGQMKGASEMFIKSILGIGS